MASNSSQVEITQKNSVFKAAIDSKKELAKVDTIAPDCKLLDSLLERFTEEEETLK